MLLYTPTINQDVILEVITLVGRLRGDSNFGFKDDPQSL